VCVFVCVTVQRDLRSEWRQQLRCSNNYFTELLFTFLGNKIVWSIA